MGISAVGWSIAPLPPCGVCIVSSAGLWTDLDDEMLAKYSAVLNPEKATYDVVDQATKERLIMERVVGSFQHSY